MTGATGLQPAAGVVTAFSPAETRAMETALKAALNGPRGANPLVGAVVIDPDGRHLVTGYHRGAGTEQPGYDLRRAPLLSENRHRLEHRGEPRQPSAGMALCRGNRPRDR